MIDQLKLGRGGFGLGSLTLPLGKGALVPYPAPSGYVWRRMTVNGVPQNVNASPQYILTRAD